MRWDDQRIAIEQTRALPGYREPAAVRTFDAPEALDVRFYEVRAKSALNRVPARSMMPFRWTVNPYRGCTHACAYCLGGETPILMGDGRVKRLADVEVGDRVYGTVTRGRHRRYVITEVEDHWSTIKPAYRITLEGGTELVASGDHRFLTRRGWKHVRGTGTGQGQRPHLTLYDRLLGTGALAAAPEDRPDYRRGYLCGVIRGDGHLGSYTYPRTASGGRNHHRFRLALTDLEALRRAQAYLEDERGVVCQEFAYRPGDNPMRAIRTSTRSNVAAVRDVVQWPRTPRPEWCKGFLAGIFDAEGSHSEVIRICNTDPEIIGRIGASLRLLGFSFAVEDRRRSNGLKVIRLKGGLRERLRFLMFVDPAISRKRSIEGIAVKSKTRLRVESIEPLRGSHRLYDITTGTGDFIANGVVSHNCFARPTHTYLGLGAGRDFEREIVVKVNAPEVLRAEVMRPRWKREHVALGTNTDPYQWVEGRYRLMPGIWEALRDSGTPGSVLTKSPLLLRDLDLMRQVPDMHANLSIPTLDEKAWRATEPHTPHPRKRLEAVAELNRAGIPCGVLIAPLQPGINDSPAQVARIIELAQEAGAVDIGGIALHLRGEVRELWFDWLRNHRPDLVPRYEHLYADGAYATKAERRRLAALAQAPDLPGRRQGTAFRRAFRGSVVTAQDPLPPQRSCPPPQQSLF